MKRRSTRSLIVWPIIVMIAGFAVYRFKFAPQAVGAYTVARGEIVAESMGTGTLVARVKATVSARIQERLLKVLVDQGDTVKSGQLLARLDDAESKQQATGTTLGDLSAFGHDARFADSDLSSSTVAGKFGKAVDFDGTADYASDSGLALTSNTVTLTAWIKPAASQADYTGIIFDRSSDGVGLNIQSDRTLRYHWPASSASYVWN